GEHFLRHDPRQSPAQFVAEGIHAGGRQVGESDRSEAPADVGPELAILLAGCPLQLLQLGALQPVLDRLGDGDAGAYRGVHAGPYFGGRLRLVGLGIALTIKRSDAPGAGLVGVIDDPSFAILAALSGPASPADRHWSAPRGRRRR